MKVIFIGSVIFSKNALEKLISLNANVVGVVTKKESKSNSDFFDLSAITNKTNIPCIYTNNINDIDTISQLEEWNADVIYCFGWSNLIKSEVLNLTKYGVIGFHPTLLPFNRGRHPLIWAKVLGLKKSGTSFFFMDEGADTGDIISQKEFNITFEDNAQHIYDKMTEVALVQLEEFHKQLESNTQVKIKQDLNQGNSWRKRNKLDGLIDFRMTSTNICNLVRALSRPYVGAHVVFNENDIKIWGVEITESNENNFEPGKVLEVFENRIKVKTGDAAVWIVEHEFDSEIQVGTYIK